MRTSIEVQKSRRLLLLREAYEITKNGDKFKLQLFGKKFHVGSDFVNCCVKNGLFKSQKRDGFFYCSNIHPNMQTVLEIMKLEKSLYKGKNGKKQKILNQTWSYSMDTHKKCDVCHKIKIKGDFHAKKDSKDGYQSTCKSCKNEYLRAERKIKNVVKNNVKIDSKTTRATKDIVNKHEVGLIRRFFRWIY